MSPDTVPEIGTYLHSWTQGRQCRGEHEAGYFSHLGKEARRQSGPSCLYTVVQSDRKGSHRSAAGEGIFSGRA
jgi:hypothetical protein